jgi:hypothetical protein
LAVDLMAAAMKSLQGELRWEVGWPTLISSGGVEQLPARARLLGDMLAPAPEPDPAACGK